MSKAIDDLVHEHEAIQTGLDILTAMVSRFERSQSMDTDDATSFLGFLKEFADKCHHGKEEGILFPALVAAGVSDKGGPVGVMLSEHARGRELIRQMQEATATPSGLPAFAQAARAYTTLLTEHIAKENDVLFPTAESVLKQAELESIYERFEVHEENVIGHGRHEELHALLDRLKTRYAV